MSVQTHVLISRCEGVGIVTRDLGVQVLDEDCNNLEEDEYAIGAEL